MRARIILDVPDAYLAARVAEINDQHAVDGEPFEPPLDVRSYVLERLRSVAEDELGLALYGWPFEATVEIVDPEPDAHQPPPPLS